MTKDAVLALRLERQRLTDKAVTSAQYEALFRLMQPVPPVYFSCPGDPPTLVHRAAFDDRLHNDSLRSSRTIVKGRFQGGTVGYVFADELELYIGAYRREIDRMTGRQQRIYDLLLSCGPLTCAQIKEESGLLVKEIMPDLHRMQEAFLVYEDQTDGDWERGWYVFAREWDFVDISRYSRIEAVSRIIEKFLSLSVFSTEEGMKSWLRLPGRDVAEAVRMLAHSGKAVAVSLDGESGWMLYPDRDALEGGSTEPERSVFVLHRSDFLVRSEDYRLKREFAGLEVLQYILVDGRFCGAVTGHWRQGPHDVEDVVVTLPERERQERKREILDAVALFYSPPHSFIRRYCGEPLHTVGNVPPLGAL